MRKRQLTWVNDRALGPAQFVKMRASPDHPRPKQGRRLRQLLVLGIAMAFTMSIFFAFQLGATVVRSLLTPEVFQVKGTFGYRDTPYHLVGDAAFFFNGLAYLHAFFVAVGYGFWLARVNFKRDLARKPDEDFSVVPKTLYGSILGFSLFGAFGFSAHMTRGDFDVIAGAILWLIPVMAPLGLFIGWRKTRQRPDGWHPDETNLPRTFLNWAGIAMAMYLVTYVIIYWLH